MSSIQNLGSILQTDNQGYIVSQSSSDKIQPKWRKPVDEAISKLVTLEGENIVSVYVRGSVARGQAIDQISDIDLLIVTDSRHNISPDDLNKMEKEVIDKFKFIQGVEFSFSGLKGILGADPKLNWRRSIIKTQTAHVYGRDSTDQLPPVKPGPIIFGHIFNLDKDIATFLNNLDTWPNKTIAARCTWIMKRILRSGYEIVMEREQAYTRDLYPCYAGFSKYYPGKQSTMWATLNLAINPITDKQALRLHLNDFGYWLASQAKDNRH